MSFTILRLPAVTARFGRRRSGLYQDIKQGLFVPPILIGARAVGWPENEVEEIIAARISGKTAEELRQLVAKLVATRKFL